MVAMTSIKPTYLDFKDVEIAQVMELLCVLDGFVAS